MMYTNPAYSQNSSSSLVPAVQYSSAGPRDTPTNYPTGHAPPQEERIYHELEEPEGERKGGGEGDYQEIDQEEGGVYHVLGEAGEGQEGGGGGMVYEVPIQNQNQGQGRDESAGRAVERAYSTLQHN